MIVKTIETIVFPTGHKINAGEVLNVSEIECLGNKAYIINSGEFIHCVIPRDKAVCESEKKYTEKEWNDMENHYMHALDKEREQKERAQTLVKELTEKMEVKNQRIEFLDFYSQVLIYTLKAACEQIEQLRKKA